ncbi:MAG: hypothetical protein SPI35_05865 [Porphyromonas sp.]|nr:hypothetical protein [Porphyromonas sp.]
MTTKTQISTLVNGAQEQVLNCEKDYTGVAAGSTTKERAEVWNKVVAENPDGLNVELFGMKFFLDRKSSLSGKTTTFSRELDYNEAKKIIGGYINEGTKGFRLVVTEEGVNVYYGKKLASWVHVCPSLVTIF